MEQDKLLVLADTHKWNIIPDALLKENIQKAHIKGKM